MNIIVVAGLIRKDDKYLLAQRIEGDEPSKNKWEFPGGKVNQGEDERDAIEREIYEEFGIKVKTIRYLTNNIYEYPTRVIDLRLYECEYISGDLNLNAHQAYTWVTKDEILNYDLAPADVALAQFVKDNID